MDDQVVAEAAAFLRTMARAPPKPVKVKVKNPAKTRSRRSTSGPKWGNHKLAYNPSNLTASQRYAVQAVIERGINVFLTGPGGCGKTHVINCVKRNAELLNLRCAVTAPTGTAAIYINGMTIHSFAKLPIASSTSGLSQKERVAYLAKVKTNKGLFWTLKNTNILIIDEVSMVTTKMLTLLDEALRAVRRVKRPFGGMVVMVIGDMMQIAPVQCGASRDVPSLLIQDRVFATWFPLTIRLSKNFRMQDEDDARVMSELRLGELSDASRRILESRGVALDPICSKDTFRIPHLTDLCRTMVHSIMARRGHTDVDDELEHKHKAPSKSGMFDLLRTHIMGTRNKVGQHNVGVQRALAKFCKGQSRGHCEQPVRFSLHIRRSRWKTEVVEWGGEVYSAFRQKYAKCRAPPDDIRTLRAEGIHSLTYEQGPEVRGATQLLRRMNMGRQDRKLHIGMRVVLTSNLCVRAPYNLANGSFGTVMGFTTASDDGRFEGRLSMSKLVKKAKQRISSKKRRLKKEAEKKAEAQTLQTQGDWMDIPYESSSEEEEEDEDTEMKVVDEDARAKKAEEDEAALYDLLPESDPIVVAMDGLRDLAMCVGVGLTSATGNPIVEFDNGVLLVIPDMSITSESIGYLDGATPSDKQDVTLQLNYTPLRPASAVTCHRAQAQTLPFGVAAYLVDMFQPGQCYVALSRAKSIHPGEGGKGGIVLYGLREEDGRVNYGLHNVKAHPYAKVFYQVLARATREQKRTWKPEVVKTSRLLSITEDDREE